MNSAPQQFGLTPSQSVPWLNFVPSCRISSIPDWKTSHSACTAHLRVLMWPVTVAFFLEFNFFFCFKGSLERSQDRGFFSCCIDNWSAQRMRERGLSCQVSFYRFPGIFWTYNELKWRFARKKTRVFSSILLNEHKCFMWAHPVSLILPFGFKSPT